MGAFIGKIHFFFALRAFSGHPSFEVFYKGGLSAPLLTFVPHL